MQDEEEPVHCYPLVIVMDDDGNVYAGKNLIGSLANPLDLTMKLKDVVEARDPLMAFAGGMDLNLEVPRPRCYGEPVYIKAEGDAKLKVLIRTLHEAGAGATRVIVRKGPKKSSPSYSNSH